MLINRGCDGRATHGESGRLLAVSRGEYSSHEVIGIFVVLQDFVPDDELEQYLQQHPDDCRAYEFADDRFLADASEGSDAGDPAR